MDSEFKRLISPSLALLTIAALTPAEHEVYIEDENTADINIEDDPDIVGITVNIDTSARAYEIASIYQKRNIPVVAGGIHVSANPDEALAYFDSVCIGEAEGVWGQILTDAMHGELKKKYRLECPADPGSIPLPNWNLINRDNYLYTNVVYTGRGCKYACEFCYNSCGYIFHKVRNRPIEDILREIREMKTRHVMFIDDNFIGNIDWTEEFLKEIKPLNLVWNAAVNTNIYKYPELLDLMRDSGCKSLFIGFESINKASLDNVGKTQNNADTYDNLIAEVHKRGIMVNASFVFGFDNDHPDVFKNTLDWLVANKIDTMTAHILTPYPGTVLYEKLVSEARIIDRDNSHYNTSNVVFQPENMSCKELRDGYLWIYKKFYSFRNIFARMPDDRRQRIPYLLFNIVYRKFGKITSRFVRSGKMNKVGRLARRLSYNIK
jgi:radical SAM superfamily enzyme YgiQ (UPF0313 family)